MVATAVTGGASFLEVTTRLGICRFRFDGRSLNQEQLGRLPSLEGDEFQRRLSLTLVHGLAMKPRWLHFYSDGASLSLRGRAPQAAKGDLNVLGVGAHGRPHGLSSPPLHLSEQKFLLNYCHLAPLWLTLNGKAINRHLDFGDCLAVSHVGDGASLPVRPSTSGRPEALRDRDVGVQFWPSAPRAPQPGHPGRRRGLTHLLLSVYPARGHGRIQAPWNSP